MGDSVFVEDSYILRHLRIRQKEIKKSHKITPDNIKFAKPISLKMFMQWNKEK